MFPECTTLDMVAWVISLQFHDDAAHKLQRVLLRNTYCSCRVNVTKIRVLFALFSKSNVIVQSKLFVLKAANKLSGTNYLNL